MPSCPRRAVTLPRVHKRLTRKPQSQSAGWPNPVIGLTFFPSKFPGWSVEYEFEGPKTSKDCANATDAPPALARGK
jgi:hypothetical protein